MADFGDDAGQAVVDLTKTIASRASYGARRPRRAAAAPKHGQGQGTQQKYIKCTLDDAQQAAAVADYLEKEGFKVGFAEGHIVFDKAAFGRVCRCLEKASGYADVASGLYQGRYQEFVATDLQSAMSTAATMADAPAQQAPPTPRQDARQAPPTPGQDARQGQRPQPQSKYVKHSLPDPHKAWAVADYLEKEGFKVGHTLGQRHIVFDKSAFGRIVRCLAKSDLADVADSISFGNYQELTATSLAGAQELADYPAPATGARAGTEAAEAPDGHVYQNVVKEGGIGHAQAVPEPSVAHTPAGGPATGPGALVCRLDIGPQAEGVARVLQQNGIDARSGAGSVFFYQHDLPQIEKALEKGHAQALAELRQGGYKAFVAKDIAHGELKAAEFDARHKGPGTRDGQKGEPLAKRLEKADKASKAQAGRSALGIDKAKRIDRGAKR
jgi:hypothetical protein